MYLILPEFTWNYLSLSEFTWISLNLPEVTWIYLNLPLYSHIGGVTYIQTYIHTYIHPDIFPISRDSIWSNKSEIPNSISYQQTYILIKMVLNCHTYWPHTLYGQVFFQITIFGYAQPWWVRIKQCQSG